MHALAAPCKMITRQMGVTEIASRIREAAKEKGLSLRELARRCGMNSPSQISQTLNNLEVKPLAIRIETLDPIAQALGVRLEWLLVGQQPRDVGAAIDPEVNHEASAASEGKFKDLPEWPMWCSMARREDPSIPQYAYLAFGDSKPILTSSMNIKIFMTLLRMFAEHTPRAERLRYGDKLSKRSYDIV